MMPLIELVAVFALLLYISYRAYRYFEKQLDEKANTKVENASDSNAEEVDKLVIRLTEELDKLQNELPADIKKHEEALKKKQDELKKAQDLKNKIK